MSKTINYGFTLSDGSTHVAKENINTPISEIDAAIKTLESRIATLESNSGTGSMGEYTEITDDSTYKRWSVLVGLNGGGQGIIQGGLANSDPSKKGYFAYKMADTVYTALEGKYCDFSGSGTVNIKERNTDYVVGYGRGQGGNGFDEFTNFGHMAVGQATLPLTPVDTVSIATTSAQMILKANPKKVSATMTMPEGVTVVKITGPGLAQTDPHPAYGGSTASGTKHFYCIGGKTYTFIRQFWVDGGENIDWYNLAVSYIFSVCVKGSIDGSELDFVYTFEWGAEVEKHGADKYGSTYYSLG